VLLVIHPRDIKDSAQYAIDQFVLRGGKLLAFVDPYAYFDQIRNPQNPQMPMGGGGVSNLDKLFKAWGVTLESGKVVADLQFLRRGGQRVLPSLLAINGEGLDQKDIVTSQVGNVLLPFPGALTLKPAAGLTSTTLIKSSKNAQLMEAMLATQQVDVNNTNVKPTGTEYAMAVRLTGKFKTAFPEGAPKAQPKKEEPPADDPNAPKPEKKPETPLPAQIRESAKENAVLIVADADFLADQASVQVQEVLGQRLMVPINGNLNFIQSLVEMYSGDENLINLRSRAAQFRPLTVIQSMQAKAAEVYTDKIRGLEESLGATQRRISELQKTKAEGQKFILSPEQQKELEDFRKKQADARKDLKDLRKNLRAETDKLETWTKIINVAAVPLLVAIIGLMFAVVKRKRVSAK
jgi:ABC-type uncharacterized transport system involved in gliding motility auxiliary subunit